MLTILEQKHGKEVIKWVLSLSFLFFFFFCVCFFLLRTELIDQSAERRHFVNVSSQIRDFEYSPETQESWKQELEKLMQDQERFRSTLLQWCYTSYGEVNCFLKTIEILLSCLAIWAFCYSYNVNLFFQIAYSYCLF